MDDAVRYAKDNKEVVVIINKLEDVLKGQNQKTINIAGQQGELLKQFMQSNVFFKGVGKTRSNIYFETRFLQVSIKV